MSSGRGYETTITCGDLFETLAERQLIAELVGSACTPCDVSFILILMDWFVF